jgi:hypothetical protein
VPQDDDEAWRAIVDNYGDRPVLDDEPETTVEESPRPPASAPAPAPEQTRASWDDPYPDADWGSERFVPPPPPPLPRTTPDRTAAWAGVLGGPVVLLVCLLVGIALPEVVAYGLVAAFVGGFVYLVLTMTREPRDPDDDGAVL